MGTVRADAWWVFKVGPVLAFAFAEIFFHHISPARAIMLTALLLVSAFGVAAYGHVVNDAFDAEADRRVGKRNRVGTWPVGQRVLLALGLLGVGFLPWVFVAISPLALGLLAGNALLLLLYAAPPFRLKERGGWGLLADAGYAHVFPVLFIFALFTGDPLPAPFHILWPVLGGGWALWFGIRGIVIHQLWDRGNDERAGVCTYVVQRGAASVHRLVQHVVYPLELVTLAALAVVFVFLAPLPLCILAGYGICWGMGWMLGVYPRQVKLDPAPIEENPYVPLVSFYSVWPALAFGITLMVADSAYAGLVLLQVLLFPALLWLQLKGTAHLVGGICYQGYWALQRSYWALRGVLSGLYRALRRRGKQLVQHTLHRSKQEETGRTS